MGDRGQRQTLRVGGAAAEISLMKVSGSPREAQYETRRVDALGQKHEQEAAALAVRQQHERELFDVIEGPRAEPREAVDDFAQGKPDVEPPANGKAAVQHGVTNADGAWVDLTERLEAIDRRCLIDGMDIAATVSSGAVRAEWVRDAHYIAPAGPDAPKVLALVWHGLRGAGKIALTRWTKRTNQALGAIVARGTARDPYLVLLELEWSANMRPVPQRCGLSVGLGATSAEERAAAERFVDAYGEKPDVVRLLRDERAHQRAELLEAAREGREWQPPKEAARGESDLAELLR